MKRTVQIIQGEIDNWYAKWLYRFRRDNIEVEYIANKITKHLFQNKKDKVIENYKVMYDDNSISYTIYDSGSAYTKAIQIDYTQNTKTTNNHVKAYDRAMRGI